MRKLTDEQVDALRWLDRFPCSESGWATGRGGVPRSPATFTHFRWKGARGSILVKREDVAALEGLYQPAPWGSGRLYEVSPAGRAALTDRGQGEGSDDA